MATGGPFTQAATTGVDDSYIPMADPSTPVQDVVTEESFSPDLGLPRLMQEDGIPMDYLNQSFSTPIEPGQDPLQAAPQQPAEQPMAPQQVEEDQGVATPGYQPKPEGGRSRASLSAPQFNQKYRYTQEDFYGAQKAPITWTDPRGVQMHVPQAGRLPMAIFASRMQQVQGERAENKQNLQKFIDGLGSPKTADPYQSSLNESVSLARDKFVNDLAAQYGGNTALAWKEIANDPNTQKRFKDMHIRFEAIGQKGQWAWDRARSYLDAIEKGGVFVHPETKKQAEDIYYGLGSMRGDEDVADIDKLTSDINKFEHSVSRDEYAKKWVLPSLEKMYAQHASNVTAKRLNSDVGTVSWEDQKSLSDSFYQTIAASMTDTIPGTTMAENKEWLKGLLPPDKVQLQLRTYSPKDPKEIGDSGGDTDTPFVGEVEKGLNRLIPKSTGGIRFPSTWNSLFQTSGPSEVEYRKVFDRTGGKKVDMGPRTFRDAMGDPITLNPQYIISDKNGNRFVSGTIPSESKSVTYISEEIDPDTNRPVKREVTSDEKSPIIILPLKEQEATATLHFGEGWDQGFGQEKATGKSVSSQDSGPSFESLKAKLPKGATQQMWDELTPNQKKALASKYQ